jgi:SAM-dependent methyltransferase
MQPTAYEQLARREEHYWWYRARRYLATSLLRRYGVASGIRALDIGCGCGGSFPVFDAFVPERIVGVDLSPLALSIARRKAPDALLVRGDLSNEFPFGGAFFDVVTDFNVLYHQWVNDDLTTLQHILQLLRPGGILLATEPAFSFLRRRHDRLGMGQRRYTSTSFCRLAQSVGFEPLFTSYFFSFTFPVALAGALQDTFTSRASDASRSLELMPLNTTINEGLYRLAASEATLISKGLRMPFGATLIAVLRRPSV